MANEVNHTPYQSVFKASIDAIFVINTRGIIIDVNQAGQKLFGYSAEELLGNNISMLMDEPHHSAHDSYLTNYQKTGNAKIIGIGREVEALKKDGSKFPIRLAVSEFTDSGVTYYTGVIHDLTYEHAIREKLQEYSLKLEQKVQERTESLKQEIQLKEEAQKALVDSQQLYEAIATNFPNGTISVLDRDLNIVFIEGAELRDNGVNTSKLVGKNYIDLIPEEVVDECKLNIEHAFEGEYQVFEISYRNNIYLARTVPLYQSGQTVDQVLHVEINITSQKRAEQEIYNALNKEKQLNELKSRFVSMASHEFRTPLSSVLSSASLIARYDKEEDQEKRIRHVNKIKSNVKNLNMILNDFLSLEKIEGGLVQNNPQELILSDFLRDVVEENEALQKPDQNVILELNHVQDEIKIDPFLLRNILNNLISNALKYSKENGEVRIVTNDSEELKITIIDNGIGISEADQQQLFTRFYRASNSTNIQGTGLGLNIVKRYLDILGGTITFTSKIDQGSSFTIHYDGKEDSDNRR
ncbi:PAS domain S-box protein [bacterium]|nr:PAS domain S-box protein [bacterium]